MTPDVTQLLETMGLPSILGLAFGGGLLLSLTPCVYPMIPITVAAFGARNVSRLRAVVLSLSYVLGIATMYSSLGVWAASTGHLFGVHMANPAVTGALGGLFALLAAISLGWFPAIEGWLSRTPSRVIRLGGASLRGAYVMGLGAGVVFAPCVGPVVVGILAYIATSGDAVLGAALLGSSALGMGLPFIVIAAFANELGRLPNAAGLLPFSRFLLGLPLLAAAAYYLSLSLSVPLVPVMLPAALGAVALSAWRLAAGSSILRWAAVCIGVGGLAVGGAHFGLPEDSASLGWRTDLDAALVDAQRTNRFAIVDFTADWCLVCHELDSTTFRDPDVAALLQEAVRIRVDATEIDDRIESIFGRFGVLGLPNVVLIDPRGRVVEHARVASFISPQDYLKILREAGLGS